MKLQLTRRKHSLRTNRNYQATQLLNDMIFETRLTLKFPSVTKRGMLCQFHQPLYYIFRNATKKVAGGSQ